MPSGTQHLLSCIIVIVVTMVTAFIWLLLHSRHCAKHFICNSSFISHKNPVRRMKLEHREMK
jgi:hypothetical protein